MQNNVTEFPFKLSTSPPNVIQSTMNPAQFPRLSANPRLAITPETMGMHLPSDISTGGSRSQQSQPATRPVVDVKSYTERPRRSHVALYTDSKQESNASYQSSANANVSKHSYGSLRGGEEMRHCLLMAQSPSPLSSPQTQHQQQQQWTFEHPIDNECPQLDAKLSVLQTLNCSGELNREKAQSLSNSYAATCGQFADLQNSPSTSETQTQEQHNLQKFRSGSDFCRDDSPQQNFKIINEIYDQRIKDIDANFWIDKDLKISIYQEWVEVLTKINEYFMENLKEMETEVTGRLELVQKRVSSNCRHSQGNEIMKCRKDIATLLKYMKSKNLDFRSLTLETITPDQVLYMFDLENLTIQDHEGEELKNYKDDDALQRNQLYANMKALAQEVAEKHDEVRELRRQVICLEDEIQKAQKKIQLKDDVIKELRNDLKCANNNNNNNNKISNDSSPDPSLPMSPINQAYHSSSNTQINNTSSFQVDNSSQFETLSHSELEEQQKIKILQHEIDDLLEINNVVNKQNAEQQRQKILKVIEELIKVVKESEKAANRKLDFIRQQLIDLESEFSEEKSDCDSGFHSKIETDHYYVKLFDAIRQRLRRHYETICVLKKKIHTLELEKNELSTSFKTEKTFSQRSSDILKQVADLLSYLKGKQFSYTDVYNTDPNQLNPFCQAISEMHKDFKEKEGQLLQALGAKNKKNEELTQLLIENEITYKPERAVSANLNDIENIDKTSAVPPQPTTHVATLVNPSPTSSTAQQPDNTTTTIFQRLVDK